MMKLAQSFFLPLFFISSTSIASDINSTSGKQLFKSHCASCHGIAGGMDMSKRKAPPIAGVRKHYIGTYPDEFSFVNAIADWVEAPDKSKTQMRGAIRRFNLMPRIEVNRSDVEKIAAYIFEGNLESPAGFKEHVEKMHGKH